MSLPNKNNPFQENFNEVWDDFFREEAPCLNDGEMKLTVCEIVENENGEEYELRIDLPPEMNMSDTAQISAILDDQSLVIRVRKASKSLH